MGDITIYTDGACSGNPGAGGWAFVAIEDGKITKLSGGERQTTNNRMELTAVIKALEYVKEHGGGAKVITDSQYVKNGITSWVVGWKKKHWVTSANQPVKNKDLWEVLDALNGGLSTEWGWVKGHAGNQYNEMCDTLATGEVAKLKGVPPSSKKDAATDQPAKLPAQFVVNLDDADAAALEMLCAKRGVSISTLLQDAVSSYLKTQQ